MAWTKARVPTVASRVFFVLIILQIPLFRVPCRKGTCETPIEMTSSQLLASEVFPVAAVKALLYPGALARTLIWTRSVPRFDGILEIYNLTDAANSSPLPDLQRLEVLAGSYFAVAGAIVGLVKPGRMTLFGVLLLVWGLVKEGLLGKPGRTAATADSAILVHPAIVVAIVCAFAAIRYDVKRAARRSQQQQARPAATPLQSSKKSKLN